MKIFVSTRMLMAALSLTIAPALSSHAQRAFSTPERAADEFIKAVAARDQAALRTILGDNWKTFIPTQGIDQEDVDAFVAAAEKSRRIVPAGEGWRDLSVGDKGWTLPIPMRKSSNGWIFDVKQGAQEIRTRRVGRNEIAAMKAALAYFDAQREYAEKDRTGDGVREYAQKFMSTPGKHDGLYWPAEGGEEESPLGPLFGGEKPGKEFHGYRFRILTAQGPNAPGGAYDYMIGGRLEGGFALVAWPADYDDTGVMTFIINHKGQIYQKNLGQDTDAIARAMTKFNPDSSWTKTNVPES